MWNKKTELARKAHKLCREKHGDRYNKAQLIDASREVYGGYGKVVCGPEIYRPVKTPNEVNNLRNALVNIDGRYPAGMTDCEVIGMNGDCSIDCHVFRSGECGEPEDHLEYIRGCDELDNETKSEILSMYSGVQSYD